MEAIVIEQVKSFLTSLDWWYMITFILIVWLFARDQAVTVWWGEERFPWLRNVIVNMPKGLRVAGLGFAYATAYYFIFDESFKQLFSSFLFVVAFHGLFLKKIGEKMGL